MTAIIGPHIIGGVHKHLATLRRWQPRLILVLDPNPDEMAQLRAACPNTVIIGRVYKDDGDVAQRIRNNPIEAAEWAHGLIMQRMSPHVDYWHVENEVMQTYSELQLLSVYSLRRMKLADDSGYKCAVGVFSVGNPDLPAHDRMALWRQFYPAMTYAQLHGHIVAVHQYGKPTLWQPDADWYIHRLEHQVLPLLTDFPALRFAVTEFGIDGLINTQGRPQDRQGWQAFTSAEQYAQDLINIGQYLEKFNHRVLGYAVFTFGRVDDSWKTYDIDGEVAQRLADHYAANPSVNPVVEPEEVKEEPVANDYDLRIESAPSGVAAWRAVEVRHLTPSENRGKRNLFVDVVDESGSRVFDKNLRIAWLAFEGDDTADLTPLDKPDTPMEFGDGNVDLYVTQTLTAWITGDGLPSDRVAGIHTRHADEPGPNGEKWNTVGHHSFYVKFQRTNTDDVVVPPTDPPTDPGDGDVVSPEVVMQIYRNTQDIARIWKRLEQFDGEL